MWIQIFIVLPVHVSIKTVIVRHNLVLPFVLQSMLQVEILKYEADVTDLIQKCVKEYIKKDVAHFGTFWAFLSNFVGKNKCWILKKIPV